MRKTTVVAYLWNYSLDILCGGNKSELARRKGFHRPDLNRMLRRLSEGGKSMRATESVLRLLIEEHCSLDQVLARYADTTKDADDGISSMTYEGMIGAVRARLTREFRAAEAKLHILRSAEGSWIN